MGMRGGGSSDVSSRCLLSVRSLGCLMTVFRLPRREQKKGGSIAVARPIVLRQVGPSPVLPTCRTPPCGVDRVLQCGSLRRRPPFPRYLLPSPSRPIPCPARSPTNPAFPSRLQPLNHRPSLRADPFILPSVGHIEEALPYRVPRLVSRGEEPPGAPLGPKGDVWSQGRIRLSLWSQPQSCGPLCPWHWSCAAGRGASPC